LWRQPRSRQRGGDEAEPGRPLDYLDKTFHIPYAVRPDATHAQEFLRSLLPEAEMPTTASVLPTSPRPEDVLPQQPAASTPQSNGRSAEIGTPAVTTAAIRSAVRRPPGPVTVEGLRFRPIELDFLPRLAPLLPTPRAIKKLTNLYRPLCISIAENRLDEFIGDRSGGPYQAASLLLTMIISEPGHARDLLTCILRPHATVDLTGDITDFLKASTRVVAHRLAGIIGRLRQNVRVIGAIPVYQEWAGVVARYSFETYELFTGAEPHG
jgi:hypothetical protein